MSPFDRLPAALRTRRAFLRAVGTSALGYPFLRGLEISLVHAETGVAPQRLVCFYSPHGVASPLFRRRESDTEDAFDITFTEPLSGGRCVLQPFDDTATYGMSFKDKLVVIDGLDFVAGATGHDGPRCVFTGSGTTGSGSSIEQYLALEAGLGAETRFSSLVLGVGTNKTGDHQDNVSYYRGMTVSKGIDPTQTFNTVFAAVLAHNDPSAAAAAEIARARGQSVVDYVRADIQGLFARLAPREQAKLDQHLTSLREIEKQLAVFEGSCQAPNAPAEFPSVQSNTGGDEYFDAITNLQVDLLAQAMACDLTRFASFWMADLSKGAVLGTGIVDDGVYSPHNPDIHQTVAHAYRGPYAAGVGIEADPGLPPSWELSGIQQRYCYGKGARLLSRLAQSGLLDSSLVVFGNDMGDTALHHSDNVPYVLAGGAGGALRTGRYLSLKPNCPFGARDCAGSQLVIPNNRLLVSIAQMFGQSIERFGETIDQQHAFGSLSELA